MSRVEFVVSADCARLFYSDGASALFFKIHSAHLGFQSLECTNFAKIVDNRPKILLAAFQKIGATLTESRKDFIGKKGTDVILWDSCKTRGNIGGSFDRHPLFCHQRKGGVCWVVVMIDIVGLEGLEGRGRP